MSLRLLRSYHDEIIRLVAIQGLMGEVHRIKYQPQPDSSALIKSESPHITFSDGAYLRFAELVVAEGRSIKRLKYSYHYEREGYFFRYDKDLERARPYCHHETHLHANQENVRFITHETSFEEVFNFIMKCFYA
ncbi:MAG: hypothetical protein H7175_22075 [Burkholderiales bacterium]|nr:hypothetical protein [Anaerolineae bacterium]